MSFKRIAARLRDRAEGRRRLERFPKPRRFDRNLVVIGAGAGGLVAAYIAAAVRASVTLIEKHQMGGDCLNTGCVPSKALIRSAKFLSHVARAKELGMDSAHAEYDFGRVMERVQRVIRAVEPHDSIERYTRLGVECIQGEARIHSPYEVEVNGMRLITRGIVIATGARPSVPAIPGIDEVGYVTSDTVWDLRQRPERLLIFGGGPIGCELSQAFTRLGCRVTQVVRSGRIMKREDTEFSETVARRFAAEGIELLLNHKARTFRMEEGEKVGTITLIFDHHVHELTDRLTDIQHDHNDEIISAMHVHLDHDNCLEVLAVKGEGKKIRAIADGLIGVRGVKHGKLVTTTSGKNLR